MQVGGIALHVSPLHPGRAESFLRRKASFGMISNLVGALTWVLQERRVGSRSSFGFCWSDA
jgi:hypothetical protein